MTEIGPAAQVEAIMVVKISIIEWITHWIRRVPIAIYHRLEAKNPACNYKHNQNQ